MNSDTVSATEIISQDKCFLEQTETELGPEYRGERLIPKLCFSCCDERVGESVSDRVSEWVNE